MACHALVRAPQGAVDPGYLAFAARLTATTILSDPWLEGAPRFRARPVILDAAVRASLERAAERLAAAYHALALACADEPPLIEPLGLTPFQRLMWESSRPRWHGIARADVFRTDAGIQICEINCDTPSGEAEAVLLGRAARPDFPGLIDPSAALEGRFVALLEAAAEGLARPGAQLTVGILYPTELTEDLSMIRLYRGWLEARGMRVVIGSPYNLSRAGDGAALFGRRCDLFVRHYKTDWWGEREPAWKSEPRFADAEPLAAQLGALIRAELDGACAVVNPFGSVLAQNKRFMALLWEHRALLPADARAAVEEHLPESVRLEALDPARLAAERATWVLKSDYGCEGAEVLIGAELSDGDWRDALAQVVPERWIAQRWFRALGDGDEPPVNHGVYLVAGEAAGFLCRVQDGVTDCHALSAPTLARPSASEGT